MPHVNLSLFIKAVPSSLPFPAVLDAHPLCMSFIFILPFCHRRVVASCFPSFPFHGYALCMPLTHAATYLVYVGTHW